jgi:DNA-binding NtrC family response regulator
MATTNRNLAEWAAKGRFREDLYYRLNVLPIELPPLRQRREDIQPLCRYFMERIARSEGRKVPAFAPGAMRAMQEYDWPGNVRELENLCQRAAAMVTGDQIHGTVVEGWLRHVEASAEFVGQLRHGRMLEDMERRLIERTLLEYDGHREKTARALGMGVRTLGMKLKQWREAEAALEASCKAAPASEASP